MRQRYDLLAFSLLVLSVALVAWLGIAGSPREIIAGAKEWQTLLAAMIALGAATLAYKGAMAKVSFDREQAAKEVARRRMGILIKLDLAMDELGSNARGIAANLSFLPIEPHTNHMTIDELQIVEPQEIEQVWEHLDVLPPRCIHELRRIRKLMRDLQAHLATIAPSSPWTLTSTTENLPPGKDTISNTSTEIFQSCAFVQHELSVAIRDLAPRIDEDERLTAVYGDPLD